MIRLRDFIGRDVARPERTIWDCMFLDYTRANGNDLSVAYAGFPGLKVGDRWCLCAARWLEAQKADVAPHVILASTHEAALEVVSLDLLKAHALDYAVN